MPEYGQFTDPLGTLNDILGEPDNQMLNPESYAPSNRPQDIRYTFPERGVEPHGVRDDTETEDYFPDQVSGDPQIETFDGPVYAEIVPPIPVPVYDVPNPQSSIRKWSMMTTVFGPDVSWTGSSFVPDLGTVQMIGADDSRVRMQLVVSRSMSVFANQVVGTGFAVSHDPTFAQYVVLGGYTTNSMANTPLCLENCKDAIYLALLPLVPYDNTKTNVVTLGIVQEFAKPVDNNPYAISK